MNYLLLDSGLCHCDYNMALDEALLEAMPRLGLPVLRFYGWIEPAGSFGYFQKYAELEKVTRLRPLVRRPTAGGLVPHDADWTYSLAFPTTDPWYALTARQSYKRVHEWIHDAFARLDVPTVVAPQALKSTLGQCFIGYEESDLLWRGKKIAGAAQRRRRDGLLIQGSVQPPPVGQSRRAWQQAMCEVADSVQWVDFELDAPLQARVAELVEQKYSRADFNQKR